MGNLIAMYPMNGGSNTPYYGGISGGSANAQTITLPSSLGNQTLSQLTGVLISFTPGFANTNTTPTLTVNSLAATTIVKGTSTALMAGDLTLSTPAIVVYNGTNFVLQNPQVGITQTQTIGNFSAGGALIATLVKSTGISTSITVQGGSDSASNVTEGGITIRGGNTTGTGAAGGGATLIQAGSAPSTGTQGFANIQQSFTVASALPSTFEVVSMTTTSDQVQAAPLGATNLVGVAQTVGGTNAQLYVATEGKTTVRFDGTPGIGNFASAPPSSTGTVGLAHDNGTTQPPAGQRLGIITGQVSGSGSGATATVLLQIGT